jgi:hypothetical protein
VDAVLEAIQRSRWFRFLLLQVFGFVEGMRVQYEMTAAASSDPKTR